MTEPADAAEQGTPDDGGPSDATRSAIRGSSVLLAGRAVSLGINFATQVLIVRTLAKDAYGVFAFGVAIAGFGEMLVTFGLRRGVGRFAPMYEERGEHGKLLGLLVLAVGAIVGLGIASFLVLVGVRGLLIGGRFGAGLQAATVVTITFLLAPVTALENLSDSLLAVFARPRAIAVRRFVLAPALRLTAVLLLLATGSGVVFLASGYVLAGVLGLAIYAQVLIRILRDRGLLERFRQVRMRIPTREVLGFTLPLMTTELLHTTTHAVDAVMLGRFRGPEDVAALRAVLPLARLGHLVLLSFAFLFTPAAARMYAKEDPGQVDELYWRTALWVAVLSFPIVAGLTVGAEPIAVLLFGDEYVSSGPLLAIMVTGYFANAAAGFNELVLDVFARIRYIVTINLSAAVANVAANLLLIPRYGAVGAAIATGGTLLLHNVLKQWGLRSVPGVRAARRTYAVPYGALGIGTVVALVVGLSVRPSLWWAVPAAGLLSAVVLLASRSHLDVAETFPELARFRLVRLVFGQDGSGR